MRNGLILLGSGGSVILPDLATCALDGMYTTFYANTDDDVFIEANANDDILLLGAAIGDPGDCLSATNAGDSITIFSAGVISWKTINNFGTAGFVDGGACD